MKDYIVDGVPLRDPQGQWFIDYAASETLTSVSRVHNVINVYGFHGELESNSAYFGAATEQIVLNVVGTDKDNLNVLVSAFYALFSAQSLDVQVGPQRSRLAHIRRHTNTFHSSVASKVKTASMRLNSVIDRKYISESACTLTFSLAINSAFWRGVTYNEMAFTQNNGSQVLDLTPIAEDSTAPLTDVELRFGGAIPATATFFVKDASDDTRSISTIIKSPIPAGGSLILDTSRLNQILANSKTTWTGTGFGSIRNNGLGQFFVDRFQVSQTFPDIAFSYKIRVGASGLPAASAATVRVRKAYLT